MSDFFANYDLRDFIYVGDVCKIVDKLLDVDDSGIYNVGTGTPRSFQSIAEAVAEKLDHG